MSLQSDSFTTALSIPEHSDVDKAMRLFRRAAMEVPAYGEHLRRYGIAPDAIVVPADFSTVPPVTKDGYLRAHSLPDVVWHRDIGRADVWSTSSGSSGEATYWPRGETALAESVELHDRIFRRMFGSHRKSTLLVVGFAMGNWIGGTYTFSAALELARRGHRISVIAPGIDIGTILTNIETLGPEYDQVVLAGYPPFVKDVLEIAGPTVLEQDVRLLVAGEAISEQWRDYVLDRLGHPGEVGRVCAIYGTADMGMVGHETETTIAIRRAAETDSELRWALFGDVPAAPTFVEYDAMIRYAETDDAGHLLYTTDGVVPLIRYRINDDGTVLTAGRLRRILRDCGHDLQVRTATRSSGYIVLHGRSDRAASLYAVNIYPDGIRSVIEAHPRSLSGKFRVHVEETERFEQQLVVEAELGHGVTAGDVSADRLRESMVAELLRTNDEYRALRAVKGCSVDPIVVLREFGRAEGPKSRLA